MKPTENWVKTQAAERKKKAMDNAKAYNQIRTGVFVKVDERTHRELKPHQLKDFKKKRKPKTPKPMSTTPTPSPQPMAMPTGTYMVQRPYYTFELTDHETDILQEALGRLIFTDGNLEAKGLLMSVVLQKNAQRTVKPARHV